MNKASTNWRGIPHKDSIVISTGARIHIARSNHRDRVIEKFNTENEARIASNKIDKRRIRPNTRLGDLVAKHGSVCGALTKHIRKQRLKEFTK